MIAVYLLYAFSELLSLALGLLLWKGTPPSRIFGSATTWRKPCRGKHSGMLPMPAQVR